MTFQTVLYVIVQILDILIVTYAIYRILLLLRDARAIRLLKGVFILFAVFIISRWLHFDTVYWVLSQSWPVLLLAIAIVFQAELRSALEHLGSAANRRASSRSYSHYDEVVREIRKTVASMARSRTGMLLVLEGKTALQPQINTGIAIDGRVSFELLSNIFYNRAPLHDGAVVIRGTRIAAASCLMPLTTNEHLDNRLGTRHRAAIGISEISDALVIVVSEETGAVSLAERSKLVEGINEKNLVLALREFYGMETTKKRKVKRSRRQTGTKEEGRQS